MYKALILGAGTIAGGYDNPTDNAILTHAHAYIDNPEIELLGFYDVNYEQAQKMAQKWDVKAFAEPINADIISVCVPDEFHTKMVLEAEKLNPKIIFLEKPVCRNLSEIETLNKVKIPIAVNYSRSYTKSFRELAKRIKENEFGKYESGCGYYGKGFIHNGSHMVNLLNLLLGKIVNIKFDGGIKDFYEDDISKYAKISFENGGYFVMNPVDCRDYTIFEMDLIFNGARIKISNLGYKIEIFKAQENAKHIGHKMLELTEEIKTDMDFAMQNAIQNIADYLGKKDNIFCTLKDGIETIKFC